MPQQRNWRIFILAASYIFYGWWNWHYVLLLAGSTIGNQFAAVAIHRTTGRPCPQAAGGRCGRRQPGRARLLQVLRLLPQLGARTSLNDVGVDYTPTIIAVALPVGISFFTFQALSLRDRHVPRHRAADVAARASPCTCRSSRTWSPGPIVRASEFLPQLDAAARPAPDRRQPGVLADRRRAVQEGRGRQLPGDRTSSTRCSARPAPHSSLEILIAIYAYAVQI